MEEGLTPAMRDHYYPKLGDRDIVGHGYNGQREYMDDIDCPFPAIRFRSNSDETAALRVKEKGDWKNLSVDEKKALYRASFAQTYAEMNANTGEWKVIWGLVILTLTMSAWGIWFMQRFVYPAKPRTINREWQEAQLKKMIVLRSGPVEGVASNYDYENNKWK